MIFYLPTPLDVQTFLRSWKIVYTEKTTTTGCFGLGYGHRLIKANGARICPCTQTAYLCCNLTKYGHRFLSLLFSLFFLCSQKFQIPCSSLLSISFVILTYKTKTMYFLLNEWMDVLQCLVPSRNTIKVSREKATSKRKTNSIKENAHKSFKCVVK